MCVCVCVTAESSPSGPAKIRRAIERLRTDVVKGLGVKLLDRVLEVMEEEDDIKREVSKTHPILNLLSECISLTLFYIEKSKYCVLTTHVKNHQHGFSNSSYKVLFFMQRYTIATFLSDLFC